LGTLLLQQGLGKLLLCRVVVVVVVVVVIVTLGDRTTLFLLGALDRFLPPS
jgi:hypothetical protein